MPGRYRLRFVYEKKNCSVSIDTLQFALLFFADCASAFVNDSPAIVQFALLFFADAGRFFDVLGPIGSLDVIDSSGFSFGFFAEKIQIGLIDEIFHLFQGLLSDGGFELALPYREHVPSHAEQFGLVPLIPFLVGLDFVCPVFNAAVRDMAVSMPVPEASMHEYHKAVFAQHDVRSSGQAFDVFPVAIPVGEEISAHNPFGLGVLASDLGHHGRPLLFVPDIH